jgi:hypothetical protein
MSDAIRLPVSAFRRAPPDIQKIKRGGTGKISNSGTAAGRFHNPIRQLRSPKDGKQIPWRPRGSVIWDPTPTIFINPHKRRHRHTVHERLMVTAPRPDPIYARRRALHAQGLTRREVRARLAVELAATEDFSVGRYLFGDRA